MSTLAWIVAAYLTVGILATVAVRGLCWLTSEGISRPRLQWAAELKSILWMVLLWPLLVFAAILVAGVLFTMNSMIKRMSQPYHPAQSVAHIPTLIAFVTSIVILFAGFAWEFRAPGAIGSWVVCPELGGIAAPGIRTRSLETEVELNDGERYVLGGFTGASESGKGDRELFVLARVKRIP